MRPLVTSLVNGAPTCWLLSSSSRLLPHMLNLPWQAWQGSFAHYKGQVFRPPAVVSSPKSSDRGRPAHQMPYSEDVREAAPQAPNGRFVVNYRCLSVSSAFVEEGKIKPELERCGSQSALIASGIPSWLTGMRRETSRPQAPVLDLDCLEGQGAQKTRCQSL